MIFIVQTDTTEYVFANSVSELLKEYAELSKTNGFTSIVISEIEEDKAKAILVNNEENDCFNIAQLAEDCKEFTILAEVEY